MKKILYLTAFVFVALSIASCQDDKVDEAWKDKNWDAYTATKADPDYKDVRTIAISKTGPEGVLFKVVSQGTGTEHPLQTSKVKVRYYGYYYDESLFDAGSKNNNIPVEFSLMPGGSIRGFSYALQNMVVGDHWKICIPYYLGYGAADTTDSYGTTVIMKGYTTLYFDVELVSITQYP